MNHPKKYLITGFSGFVSAHFLDLLNRTDPGALVIGVDRSPAEFSTASLKNLAVEFQAVDLLNRNDTDILLHKFQPDYILHFASVSSVAQSWLTPLDSFVNNTNIFLNLVEQVRKLKLKCRILSVGSSEEFGEVNEQELPLTENHPLKPLSPYAVARVAQEMLSKIYADGYGMDIIMTRSFNHIGPGQKDIFVISSFARQLVEMATNPLRANLITVGNLAIVRDFVDVRDVVRAYLLLLKEGRSGEIYNVCSGTGVQLEEILYQMAGILGIQIHTKVNPELIRPNDNKKIIGSYHKIKNELGWSPEINLRQSLEDILLHWKTQLKPKP